MDDDRLEEEVARLFRYKLEVVLGDPEVVRRVSSSVRHRDVLICMGEVWGEYLLGLEEHGVRRVARLAHLASGSVGDEVVIADPFFDSSVELARLSATLIVVPREFGLRMVVLGGLP